MTESHKTSFDQIKNLAWYPFIGEDYKGTIILAESHYDSWPDIDAETSKEWLASKEFTQKRVIGTAFKESGSGDKIYRNLEKAVFGKSTITAEERNKLWNSTSFMNLVQRPMATIKERPIREDYREGWEVFWEVNKILNAEEVIVLGTTLEKIQTFRQLRFKYEFKIEEKWSLLKNNKSFEICFELDHPTLKKVIFIKHPSSYFSWEICSNFLTSCNAFSFQKAS